MNDWKALIRISGILLMVEGALMLLCLIPAYHYNDGSSTAIQLSAAFTFAVGCLAFVHFARYRYFQDRRMAFVLVVAVWLVLVLFGTLPYLATGTTHQFVDALFESMSGLTSSGGTIFAEVGALPYSVLFWRSLSQWVGGFGIILLVLAVAPSIGINKYSLYTAEASGADNTGKLSASTSDTVRHTLFVYLLLTAVFVVALSLTGMAFWPAVNLTFTNISSGGFSVYSDSIASLSMTQKYVLAGCMFCSGINFALLYHFITFRWRRIRHKLDQFSFYFVLYLVSVMGVFGVLHFRMGQQWSSALCDSVVQCISALTTTGSVVADTTQWWVPVTFWLMLLSLCGGMAGSTTGGLKVMRVLILRRNVRNILHNYLHPNAVHPVRLNGTPVSHSIINNVMVIFFVYLFTIVVGILALMLCGVNATESIGAMVSCITSYGPGMGLSGGFGSYAAFPLAAKLICSLAMLMGRLECLTFIVLFLPRFWHR